MKTNKMMRLASILLVAVMISTCAISGTFAKYVTSDSAVDEARVAKFGVVVTASGSLFSNNYFDVGHGNGPTDGAVDISVKSSGAVDGISKLVAPGTKNVTGMTFAVTGTPEVAVRVDIAVENVKEVFLIAKDDLPDMTTGDNADTFDNADDYYPVKFTLTQNGTPLVTDGKLSDVETALVGLSNTTYGPNTDLAVEVGTLVLTWEWEYGVDDGLVSENDKKDTLLGDLAADPTILTPATTLNAGTDYNLTTSIDITVTVTQVD